MSRGDLRQIGLATLLVAAAAAAHFLHVTSVLAFAVAAAAIALLAQLVGGATEQLGGRLGSSAAGVVQSPWGISPSSSSPCLRCSTASSESCRLHWSAR
jgi:Ca2+:H+ antiporter